MNLRIRIRQIIMMLIALGGLSGCLSVDPSSIVDQPRTARPSQQTAAAPSQGAIFQSGQYRSLYEDYRAHQVGDVLTILIQEKVSADKKNAASDSKSGKIDTNLQKIFGMSLGNMNTSEQTTMQSDAKAAGSASYVFSGTIAVTVIEVLSNGNLMVSGEKQIGMDKGTEFVRLSGVVVPQMIQSGNILPSSKLADARIEYRTNAQIDPSELLKSLQRIFSAVLLL